MQKSCTKYLPAVGKRKEIVSNSLLLFYFAACPAELQVRRGGFFLFAKTQSRKEIVVHLSVLTSCLPAGGLCGLASLRAKYFLFTLAKAQSRKEIVVHQKKNPLPQFYGTGSPIEPATY